MALFKIFRRNQTSDNNKITQRHQNDLFGDNAWSDTNVKLPPVRLIIFRENEWKERRLMYDSEIINIHQQPKSPHSNAKSQHAFIRRDHSPLDYNKSIPFSVDEDETSQTPSTQARLFVKSVAELIFGSVGMAYKGETVKLHELRNSSQLMLTHVFQLLPRKRKASQMVIREHIALDNKIFQNQTCVRNINESDSDSNYSTINSVDSFLIITDQQNRSNTIRIPKSNIIEGNLFTAIRPKMTCLSPSPENDGSQGSNKDCSMSGTPQTPTPITASWKSLQLSYMKNSFENVYQRRHSQPAVGVLDEDELNACYRKRTQIGLAVLFTVDSQGNEAKETSSFRRFVFSHMQIIENELIYLKKRVANHCYCKKPEFLLYVSQAWSEFCLSLQVLFESPRLCRPIWTILTADQGDDVILKPTNHPCTFQSSKNQNDTFIEKNLKGYANSRNFNEAMFIDAFYDLAEALDKKETNFFLSAALTTFLTFHSGWVSSVAPPTLSAPTEESIFKPSTTKNDMKKANYCPSVDPSTNPFGAQLLDVWSVFNSDRHSLRTIFLGNDKTLLTKLVFVFSYFLRCNNLTKSSRFDTSSDHDVSSYRQRHCSSINNSKSNLTPRAWPTNPGGDPSVFTTYSNRDNNNVFFGANEADNYNIDYLKDNMSDTTTASEATSDYGASIDNLCTFLYDKIRCPSFEMEQQQPSRNLSNNSKMTDDDQVQMDLEDHVLVEDRIINKQGCDNLFLDKSLTSTSSLCMTHLDMCDDHQPKFVSYEPSAKSVTSQQAATHVRSVDQSIIYNQLFECAKIERIFGSKVAIDHNDEELNNYCIKKRMTDENEENNNNSPISRDYNNNFTVQSCRFDNPGLSLQTSLQTFGQPGFFVMDSSAHINSNQHQSYPYFNPSFALTALLTGPMMPSSNRKQGPFGQARYKSRMVDDSPEIQLCEKAIREALLRSALQCDSSTGIGVMAIMAADTRDWTVKLLSCETNNSSNNNNNNSAEADCDLLVRKNNLHISETKCLPARTVLDLVENVKILKSLNSEPEFIMMYIEDWLADIYRKGSALVSLLDESLIGRNLNPLQAVNLVGADPSDTYLLLSVCSF